MSATSDQAMAAALAQAATVLEHGVDKAGPLSKPARSLALDTISWLCDAPLDHARKEGHRAAGVAQSKGLELEAAGILEAFADGTRIASPHDRSPGGGLPWQS